MGQDRFTALNRNHNVGDFSQRRAVGNYNQGTPRQRRTKIQRDQLLGIAVQRGGWLVENQYARTAQEGARQSDPLALAGRESESPFARFGLIAFGKPRNQFVQPRRPCGRLDGGLRGAGKCVRDILGDAHVKQVGRLIHQHDLPAQVVQPGVANILAVNQNAAPIGIEVTHQQIRKSRLAHTARPQDRIEPTGGNFQRNIIKYRRPVVAGAAVAFFATIVTWFIAVGILHDLGDSVSALNLQAASGLLAVVVLLVVMNWFFHKIYWGGWISLHNRKKRELLNDMEEEPGVSNRRSKLWWGLGLLGFASLYREGFEVVLFLQGYYLKMGGGTVLTGAAVGLALSAVVAVLTFVGQRRLPYRKMLIFTGVLLGIVLLVMVGEQAQEMQLAHWLPTTNIARLQPVIPDWAGVWFSVFPTVETLAAQGLAAILVVGSYYGSRRLARA